MMRRLRRAWTRHRISKQVVALAWKQNTIRVSDLPRPDDNKRGRRMTPEQERHLRTEVARLTNERNREANRGDRLAEAVRYVLEDGAVVEAIEKVNRFKLHGLRAAARDV